MDKRAEPAGLWSERRERHGLIGIADGPGGIAVLKTEMAAADEQPGILGMPGHRPLDRPERPDEVATGLEPGRLLKRPLDEILSNDDVYLLSHWRNKPGERYQGWGLWPASAEVPENGEFQQWHVVSEPGHPFLEAVIEKVGHNIDTYDPSRDGVGKKGVITVTGPLAFTQAIWRIADQHRHRVVDILGLGFVYSIFETQTVQTAHQFQFKGHYSTLQEPIVVPSNL